MVDLNVDIYLAYENTNLDAILFLLPIWFPNWYLVLALGLGFEKLLPIWIQIGINFCLLPIRLPNWYLLMSLGV